MKTLFSFFILGVLLVACRKDKVLPSEITIGESGSLKSLGIKDLIEGSISAPRVSRFDLDDDGVFDVKVYSAIESHAFSGELLPRLYLETLHPNCKIRVNSVEDSIFEAQLFDSQLSPQGVWTYFYTTRNTCESLSPLYVFQQMETWKNLVPLQAGEILHSSDEFASGKLFFTGLDSFTVTANHYADSSVFHFNEKKRDCYNFPVNIKRFIGFKVSNNGAKKLGWIELEYRGGNTLLISDWVIQH